MKLLIDARTVRTGRTGVGNYAAEFVRALDAADFPGDLHVLSLKPECIGELKRAVVVPVRTDYESHPAGEWFMQVRIPALLRDAGFDAFWGPAFLAPWWRTRAKRLVTVHDIAAFTHPECYPKRFAKYIRTVTRLALRSGAHIVALSDFVREQILEKFGIPGERITTIHPGVSPFFSPGEAPANVPQPYLLAIGAGAPRKNDEWLLRLWETVKTRHPEHRLVLVGQHEHTEAPSGIIRLPHQSREKLRELYRGAALFLFPSVAEGFGLPTVEAMACGCPVAAADAGALPEVGGDAALYFSLTDTQRAAEKITGVLRNPDELASMREKGLARAACFTWENAAAEMITLLKRIVVRHG